MPNSNFARNLRAACNQHGSVAEVCRSLEMNRQQFNKYLSGKIYPSKHNLYRLCAFFKQSEQQFNLSPEEFSRHVEQNRQPETDPVVGEFEKFLDSLPSSAGALSRYEGYYHSHFLSSGFPGYMGRSLVRLYQYKGRFYTKTTDHLWTKNSCNSPRHRFKYKGMVFYLGDRIFITEAEILTKTVICHTILFPSYRNVVDRLSGITMGVSSASSHRPMATRIEFQFLGRQIDLRKSLRDCGIFKLDNEEIDSEIRDRIFNENLDTTNMLTARDY